MDSNIQYINSITKAFDILRLFDDETYELGIREISAKLDMNKTTVYRIVKTLEINNMLVQNPINRKYYPGLSILQMAHKMFKNYGDKDLIYPYMLELQKEFNEDIVFSVLSGTNVVCIERLESDNGLILSSRIGRVLPITSGATSKAFLPFLPEETISSILDSFETKDKLDNLHSKRTRQSLEADIALIRKKGYAISYSEVDTGVCAIAVPIFDNYQRVAYSLGICGTTHRMESKGIESMANKLLEASKILSKGLESLKTVQR